MRAIVASDNQTVSTKLRHAVIQLGYDCPIGHVLAIEEAGRFLQNPDPPPDLILFGLPEDEERGLKQLHQFSAQSSARIIVVGPGNDPRLILETVHAGADDYLIENQDLYQQLSSFLNRLTAKRATAAAPGKLTVVTSVGGGCGASIVASNLAILIARERGGCALLDFDGKSGDQAALFNLKPRHTLGELCHNIDGCDQKMLEQSLTEHSSGVRLLAASQRLADNRHLSRQALHKIARITRSTIQDVVIDLGSSADGGDPDLLQSADRIMLVFRRDFPGLRRLRLVLDAWDSEKIEDRNVHLIANSCGQAKRLSIAKIQSALRRELLLSLPDDRQAVNLSIDSGNPVVLDAPKSPFSKSMRELGTASGVLAPKGKRARKQAKPQRQSIFSRLNFITRSVVEPAAAQACK